jgi:tetratricopeptide (TPR) repeat protein
MIVKNESKIIERLLKSVIPFIDAYCICDTGSTDNTIELIQNIFAKAKIPGKIMEEPFRDFGYNRSVALAGCHNFPECDYVLLLDADMIFKCFVSPSVFKSKLISADAHYILQGNDKFLYKNTRIVRNSLQFTYWGVTHEYMQTPPNTNHAIFDKSELFILDIGDGGAKDDKCQRDIRLLLQGLVDIPNNDRYTFYLANSYRDSNQYEKAIESYKKRIEIGGWIEEVWYSYYNIGRSYKSLNDIPNAIYYWMEGYHKFPERIENIYEIVNYYRMEGKNQLAYFYYELANYSRNKKTSYDHLFLQKDIYDYLLDYELSIFGYYFNSKNYDLAKVSMKVLAGISVSEDTCKNVMSNYKFYAPVLKTMSSDISLQNLGILSQNMYENTEFNGLTPSTPSICLSETGDLIVCRRYVNYKIDDGGGYINNNNIVTKNLITKINTKKFGTESWQITDQYTMEYNKTLDDVYVGIEDVRLLSYRSLSSKKFHVLYNGNRGLSSRQMSVGQMSVGQMSVGQMSVGQMSVEHGRINMNTHKTESAILLYDERKQIEKNWVLFMDPNDNNFEIKCIYNWSPLTIGTIDENAYFTKVKQQNTPAFFNWVRGSTNGQQIGDEIWFINHVVSYENRRYYYHMITVLDATTLNLKKYTKLFTFEKEKVEYTLGFVYLEKSNELMIGYSLMDRETKYLLVNKLKLDEMMIQSV